MTEQAAQQKSLRLKRLKIGVISAMASRAVGMVLQMLMIPLGVNYLGVERYAAYAAIVSLAAFPVIFQLKYGPTFVIAFSSAIESKREDFQTSIFQTALVASTFVSCMVALAFGSLVGLLPVTSVFISLGDYVPDSIRTLLLIALAISSISSILTVVELAQTAWQENHWLSIRSILSNVATCILLLAVFPIYRTIEVLVLITIVPQFIGSLFNAMIFFRHRSYLLFGDRNAESVRCSKELIMQGIAFSIVGGMAAYFCNQLPVLTAANYLDARTAVMMTTMLAIVMSFFALVSLILTPLTGALANSISANDLTWTIECRKRVQLMIIVLGAGCTIAQVYFGQEVFSFLIPKATRPSELALLATGIYLTVLALENHTYTVCLLLSDVWIPSIAYLLRAFATGAFALLSGIYGNVELFFLGATFASLVFTLAPLTRRADYSLASRMQACAS